MFQDKWHMIQLRNVVVQLTQFYKFTSIITEGVRNLVINQWR
jgi:hypothetical protein